MPEENRRDYRGEVTAFLTILFVLMAGFICAVADVAAAHEEKCYQRAKSDLAIYSVFGEYRKELQQEYHIFGMDTGYGGSEKNFSEDTVIGRLRYYGAEAQEQEITDVQFLTDRNGAAFYEQALYYMELKYGLAYVKQFMGLTGEWEEYVLQGEKQEKEKREILEEVNGAVDMEEIAATEDEAIQKEAEHTVDVLEDQKNSFLLERVLPENFSVSNKALTLEEQPSHRNLNCGYGTFRQKDRSGVGNRLLFHEYLLEHFSNVRDETEKAGLQYEVEYLVAGKGSDRENLESVVRKLMLIRYAANYLYLQTSTEKKAEAETMAATVCTLLLLPGMTEVVKQALLLIWSYQESIQDIKALLSGGKVPLQKDSVSWKVSLGSVFIPGSKTVKTEEYSEGLEYKDYVRILLFCADKEELSMRSLDMMEQVIRAEEGGNFKVDLCIAKMKLHSTVWIRESISYEYPTEFAYQ